MKKIILLISVISASLFAHSQIMVNGDFSINHNNDVNPPCYGLSPGVIFSGSGPTTFSDGSVPNWFNAFGTPNFGGSFPTLPFPSSIGMEADGDVGEGIVGLYPFVTGVTYQLNICIQELTDGDAVRIVAGKNPRPIPLLCDFVKCGTQNDGMHGNGQPTVPSTILPTDPTMTEVPHITLFNGGNNIIYFTSPGDYDWIMIFPTAGENCTNQLTIKYFWVYPMCIDMYIPDADHILPASSYNPITTGLYEAPNIIIATFLGFPSIPVVSTNSHGVTNFRASYSIDFDNHFFASASEGYMDARIDNICDKEAPIAATFCQNANTPGKENPLSDGHNIRDNEMSATIKLNSFNESKFNLEINQINNEELGKFTILPNPASNDITITYPCSENGKLIINIMDITGRSQYSEDVICAEGNTAQHVVDISSYKPGVYMVDVKLNDQHTIKKIVKI